MGTLVYFRCVAAEHQRDSRRPSDKLTIEARRWAYCPYDVRAGGHRWEETGGVPYHELLSATEPGVPLAHD